MKTVLTNQQVKDHSPNIKIGKSYLQTAHRKRNLKKIIFAVLRMCAPQVFCCFKLNKRCSTPLVLKEMEFKTTLVASGSGIK
jgi:hypothetical protein